MKYLASSPSKSLGVLRGKIKVSIIPILESLRQEDCHEFKAIMGYRVRLLSQKERCNVELPSGNWVSTIVPIYRGG